MELFQFKNGLTSFWSLQLVVDPTLSHIKLIDLMLSVIQLLFTQGSAQIISIYTFSFSFFTVETQCTALLFYAVRG